VQIKVGQIRVVERLGLDGTIATKPVFRFYFVSAAFAQIHVLNVLQFPYVFGLTPPIITAEMPVGNNSIAESRTRTQPFNTNGIKFFEPFGTIFPVKDIEMFHAISPRNYTILHTK
jgi:hypothetical protein